MASSQTFSDTWVKKNIVKYKGMITSIAVGNEWLHKDSGNDPSKLVPAMWNLHRSLHDNGLDEIQVSTPHAFDVITDSYPPSHGKFRNKAVMRDLLKFLYDTKSFLMMNIYPYFSYKENREDITLDYALFRKKNVVVPDIHGREYTNLFDAMVDAVIYAMADVDKKYKDMKIVITETGWPNGGGDKAFVNPEIAREYNQNVINHVLTKKGTPMRPNQSFETYIFALFNEDQKKGDLVEQHFGHFHPDKKPVYVLKMDGT